MHRFAARSLRIPIAALLPLGCSGCGMLGELFHRPGLGLVVLVVVAAAAIGFVMSRSKRL